MARTLVIRPASHIFLGMSAKPLFYHTFLFAENAPDLRHDSIIQEGWKKVTYFYEGGFMPFMLFDFTSTWIRFIIVSNSQYYFII